MEQGAQQDKDVEDLVAAEAGIVPARPFDGVEHAAHGVEHAAAHGPEEAGRGEHLEQRHQGGQSQPAHEDIDARGKPAGGGDPRDGEYQPGQGQTPDHRKHAPAPEPHIPQHHQAHRGIGAGNEEIDGGVVIFPQGDAAPDGHIAAVVEGAGCIQPHHAHAVDEEGDHVPRAQPQGRAAQQQEHGAGQGQHGADAVGNGRPGAQAVIGIPILLPHSGPAGRDLDGAECRLPARQRVFHVHKLTFLFYSITPIAKHNQYKS